ncbi:MAG: DUF3971 domain-containing protein, partial [Gammaproteobacteria bacterium]|nr:DUF3971 domain-containing protein [Gammaproteobacteria bacterium]
MTQSLDPRLRHAFWFVAELFAAVASALALLLIILRLAMPHADAFKPQLEAWASEAFGETVRIGTVEGHWPGLDLTVVLGDVEMLAPDGSVRTRFDRAYVGLDPLASLFKGTLAVRELHLDGLELTLFGDVLVDAAANASPDPALRPAARADFGWFLPWLFSQRQVDVTSGRLHWPGDPAAAPPFDLFSLRTRSDGDHHELAIRLEALSGSASVDLAAGIDGEARVRESWNGQVYLRGNRVRWETVAALLDRLAPGSTGELLSIDDTLGLPEQADFELWADARDGHLARVLGEGALSDPPGRALLGIARVATRFDWRPDGPGWDLAIDGVEVEPVGGRRYRTGPARVRYAASPGRPAQVEAALASVDLAILHRVAGAGKWLDEAQVARLDGFAPRGQLYDLRGRWTAGDGDVPARWRVVGEAWDLAVAPWRKWPGVEGLRVAFDVGPDGGHGTLFGRDGSLQLPWLFREPLALERVDGTVRVSRDARGWSLRSDDLEVANRHVQTHSRLEATLPADGGAPFLDLEVGYRDGDAGEAWRYLPAGIMPGPVVDWVDRGIVSGRVVEGGMVLRGPLDRFPFDGHEGRFQVRFLVEDVTLDYLEGWPPIEGLDAWVEFAGRGMRIEARDGRILGATLGPTVADTPDLTAKPTPRLRIDGRVTGDADDGLRYLRESPLQSRFGDYLEVARGRGRIDLDLALAVALKGGTTDVDGTLRLDGVTLDLPTYGIVVERGRGTLTFDNDSLAGNGLQAEWRGMPVGIDVQVPDDAEAGRGGPRITARGRA